MRSSLRLARAIFVSSSVLALLAGPDMPGKNSGDDRLREAEKKLKTSPDSFQAYNDLAAALCRRARDTGEVSLYDRADSVLQRSQQLSPGNYDARKLEVLVLIGRQDYLRALPLAQAINHSVPDDIAGWAFLVDANIGLGNYSEAERDAQWILDLRQGNALGFEKAAALRELFGDTPGAVEFVDEAYRRTSANDTDQRAWLLLQKSRLQLHAGYRAEAGITLAQARQINPGSLLALKIEARLRAAEGKPQDALALVQRCYERVPSTANLYAVAEMLERSGRMADANLAFQRFAREAQAGVERPGNPTVQLVLYKLDRENDKPTALPLAAKLAAERHDCATLDAFAWALYKNGKFNEAKQQEERALAVGVRDPQYFCHAIEISSRAGDPAAAHNFKRELETFDGYICPADFSTRTEARQ
ncbi:MAG: tetratricopeptide repeat protein [Bryobacteraceae bacterium]